MNIPAHGCCFSMTLKAHARDSARRSQNVVDLKQGAPSYMEKGEEIRCRCCTACQRTPFQEQFKCTLYSNTKPTYICLSKNRDFVY